MNNYCRNCGEKLTNNNVCEKCNTKVLNARVGELDVELARRKIFIFFSMVIFLLISYAVIFFYPGDIGFASMVLGLIYQIMPIAIFVFVVDAKVKLRYSKFFNIVFWLMLIFLILIAAYIILALISCEYKF